MNRRQFLVASGKSLPLLFAVTLKPALLFALAKLKLIDEKNPQVKGLHFTQDATTSTMRKNLQATCKTCRQWQKKENDGKEVDGVQVASCQMFAGMGYAKETGWCMAWTKSPKIK